MTGLEGRKEVFTFTVLTNKEHEKMIPRFIKNKCQFTDGALKFLIVLKRVLTFPNENVKKIQLKKTVYFVHPENITAEALGNSDEEIRHHVGVEAVSSLHAADISIVKFMIPKLNLSSQLFLPNVRC